jgi:hypothetical protein
MLHRYSWEVLAEVRHVSRVTPDRGKPRYRVGLQFPAHLADVAEVLERLPPVEPFESGGPDRRQSQRVVCAGDASLGVPRWATVALKDLSQGGAMFTSPIALDPGDRAQLHVRLGEASFRAMAEIRRQERRSGGESPLYTVSAAFVSMTDESRQSLASFLTSPEAR